MAMDKTMVNHRKLKEYVKNIFIAAGLTDGDASLIARHLVLANLRGVESHGVTRVNIYVKRLEKNLIEKRGAMTIERETNTSALLNGNNRFGIVNAQEAVEFAVRKAKAHGIGVVGVHHSNHCGMLADYVQYATAHHCIALATTNAPANMAPWGGKEPFFGTNPLAYGIPTLNSSIPIVFDMATSVVARGKITYAQKNNQKIPIGWAITKEGNPTTNPNEALEGLVLPVGGPKGYGLALFVEILSSIFTGAAYGQHIGSLIKDFGRTQNIGHFFFVMRADLFMDIDVFLTRIEKMINDIKSIPLATGYERIYLPGELENIKMKKRKDKGIPLTNQVIEDLNSVGKRLGLNSLLSLKKQ